MSKKSKSAKSFASPAVVADPSMFSGAGGAPCPRPVLSEGAPADLKAMGDGLRMRENPAEWAFVRLSRLIEDFEKGLDKDDEVGASVVGLPGDGTMRIEDVGFWSPDLIMFLGKNADGKPIRLVQHYTQVSVVLSAMKKPEERETGRRIGFQLSELVDEGNAAPKPKA